MLGLYYDDE
jgi:heme/copper-type cytochrome/quinol oxidase subunit 2